MVLLFAILAIKQVSKPEHFFDLYRSKTWLPILNLSSLCQCCTNNGEKIIRFYFHVLSTKCKKSSYLHFYSKSSCAAYQKQMILYKYISTTV